MRRPGRLPYSCLAVDHDDTSVASTPAIHYPAHLEALRRLRPERRPPGLDGWMRANFDPGLTEYLVGELGFGPEEMALNYEIWRSFTRSRVPAFFPGFLPLLADFRARGGLVVVISHSEEAMIRRDYISAACVEGDRSAEARGRARFLPDAIFGWSDEPALRKPSPYPLRATMERFGLEPGDILVLDDLKPGADMAAAAGVDCAAAGWGHDIPEIRAAMRASCRWYFATVEEFARFLFDR